MLRILHIDDEELIRTYLEDIVDSLYEDTEIEIVGFSSWSDAETFIKDDQNFDLVFLDEIMPFINGSEIIKILDEKYPTLSEKVIFVAGPTNIQNYDKPHIKKPFDLSTIKDILDGYLKIN